MDKKIAIDFLNCTEDECIEFAKKIENDEIDEDNLINTLNYFKNKDDYFSEEAIEVIKNLVLTRYYVNYTKTEFLTYSGRVLLTVAEEVRLTQTLNLNILYALCWSQLNEDLTAFKDTARMEIIDEIFARFDSLCEKEKKGVKSLKKCFIECYNKSKFKPKY